MSIHIQSWVGVPSQWRATPCTTAWHIIGSSPSVIRNAGQGDPLVFVLILCLCTKTYFKILAHPQTSENTGMVWFVYYSSFVHAQNLISKFLQTQENTGLFCTTRWVTTSRLIHFWQSLCQTSLTSKCHRNVSLSTTYSIRAVVSFPRLLVKSPMLVHCLKMMWYKDYSLSLSLSAPSNCAHNSTMLCWIQLWPTDCCSTFAS